LILLKCDEATQTIEKGRPCTVLCAEVVWPKIATGTGVEPIEYVKAQFGEMARDWIPSGPLTLTPHREGGDPALTVSEYRIFEVWAGRILFFLSVYDAAFDASPFIGRVYAADANEYKQPVSTEPASPFPEHVRRLSLLELGLSPALLNCLESEGITTAGDLCIRSAEELLEIRNLGPKRLQEVRDRVAAVGMWLWGEEPRGDKAQH